MKAFFAFMKTYEHRDSPNGLSDSDHTDCQDGDSEYLKNTENDPGSTKSLASDNLESASYRTNRTDSKDSKPEDQDKEEGNIYIIMCIIVLYIKLYIYIYMII